MTALISIVYNLFVIPLLWIAYRTLAVVHPKVRKRAKAFNDHRNALRRMSPSGRRLWFHAASMGEFEQLKSVIEQLRERDAGLQIIVSFSSASGFENARNYPAADVLVYLPFDTYMAMSSFIAVMNPCCLVLARYDLWWNCARILKRRAVPIVILNATYPSASFATTGIGRSLYRELMNCVTQIYAVSEKEYSLFKALRSAAQITQSADSRYDRLIARANDSMRMRDRFREGENSFFKPDDVVIVLGSVWSADCQLLLGPRTFSTLESHTRLIIVPHEPTERIYDEIEELVGPCDRWSALSGESESRLDNATISQEEHEAHLHAQRNGVSEIAKSGHVIVDSVGQLLAIYALADAAYVGGGFGAGVHSVAEAACYGIPVAFGPAIERNNDALHLSTQQSATLLQSVDDAIEWLDQIQHKQDLNRDQGQRNAHYVRSQGGSSAHLAEAIENLMTAQREARA